MSAAVSRVSDPDSEHLSPDVPYQGQPDVIRQTGHLFVEWGGGQAYFLVIHSLALKDSL